MYGAEDSREKRQGIHAGKNRKHKAYRGLSQAGVKPRVSVHTQANKSNMEGKSTVQKIVLQT